VLALAFALPSAPPVVQAQPSRAADLFSSLPLTFEPNVGQWPANIRYLARGPGYSLVLTRAAALVDTLDAIGRPAVIRMQFLGGAASTRIVALQRQAARVNDLIGRNPRSWHVNIPTYARIEYRNLYPGIDLAFHGAGRSPEYDWIVHPGADLSRIALSVHGAGPLRVDAEGNLAGSNGILQGAPRLYQDIGGKRIRIPGGFRVLTGTTVGFSARHFDHAHPLIVDPTLSYSARVGGAEGEGGYSLAVDRSGNTIVTGDTSSGNFPVASPIESTLHASSGCLHAEMPSCIDAFVLKLSASGQKLIYSTFIGGGGDDYGHGVAVDREGNVYVAGSTSSADFPTVHAGQSQFAGGGDDGDAYILKLNPAGNSILFSTYLGGSGNDDAEAIKVSGGKLYVAGSTASANFPTLHAWQTSLGGHADAFLARFTTAGKMLYSTFLGGTGTDGALGVATGAGRVFVAGYTGSSNFPTVHPLAGFGGGTCVNDPQNVCQDAFVAAFPQSGGKPIYSTYLGGSREDRADAVAADRNGYAYVVGGTYSRSFPLAQPFQKTLAAGDQSGFVAGINPAGTHLLFSTFLGGTSLDEAYGVAVDAARNIFVTGTTVSDDFPTQDAIQPAIASSGPEDIYSVQNAFITVFAPNSRSLLYSTYLGGVGQDLGADIVTDGSGNAYITGFMTSKNFPRTNGAFHSAGGQFDTFIAKIHSVPIARAEREARARARHEERGQP
jgi:hypothetical protein